MHIAIIAEYNPFHNGHAYQIREARRIFGPDARISVILGGIFSQRGEAYIAPPYVRAEAAVKYGADIVLEMPFPFSAAPAAIFARAGVRIAEGIGADVLLFGSECGDTDLLKETVLRLDSEEMKTAVTKKDISSIGKTRAFSEAFYELYGENSPTDMPNDILAIEYIRAINGLGANVKPYAIKRMGDYKSGEGEYPSASSLRLSCKDGKIESMRHGIPSEAYEVFEKAKENGLLFPDIERLTSAVMLNLASCEEEGIAFSSSGIIGRLKNAAKEAKSISSLLSLAKTKIYTDAELSRAMLYSLLSVKREDIDEPVYYTKLLAASEGATSLLGKGISIELVTKPTDLLGISEKARAQYERTFIAERAFSLCLDGEYNHLKQSPKIIQKQ